MTELARSSYNTAAGVPLRVDDEPVLLATKLHPPARRGLLPRPGLVHRLRPTVHRLTVLDAPAGWGKTSLLAEWCANAHDVRVAWVALDTGEVLSGNRIEPDKTYWRNQQRDPGRWPGSQATP
mgnify:CR=1 FL=1